MGNVGLLHLTNLKDQGQRGTSTPVYGGVDVAPDFRVHRSSVDWWVISSLI